MTKAARVLLALAVVSIPACGGSNNSPTAPAPTPPPPVSYSGTYSGPMLFNVAGQAQLNVNGSVPVTHSGNTITYGTLTISGPVSASYALGNASLSGDTANGTSAYQSAGCGIVNLSTTGRFGPPLINLTVVLIPTSSGANCGRFELRGELRR